VTLKETLQLLRIVAAIDHRTVGETDVTLWHAMLGDIGLDDAQAAVIAYFRESREWLMPADVRARVMRMRSDRLAQVPSPAPRSPEIDDDPAAYQAALKAMIKSIADGKTVPAALAAGREPSRPPEEARREIEKIAGHAAPGGIRKLSGPELAAAQLAELRADRAHAGQARPDGGESAITITEPEDSSGAGQRSPQSALPAHERQESR
jgi:hypothetical protein